MGNKLLWTGLVLIFALDQFLPKTSTIGAIIMILGVILLWLDK